MEQEIEVVATRDGHYGIYRWAGTKFRVRKSMYSDVWMAPVDSERGRTALSGKNTRERDALTGERLASGGTAAQAEVLAEENRELKARLAKLEAAMAAAPERTVKAEAPADADEKDNGAETEVTEPKPRVRRRRD